MIYRFDEDILQILSEAGSDGLSVRKLSRHVFNLRHTMFDELTYDDVHAYVAKYLLKSSKLKQSPIIHAEKKGVYRVSDKYQMNIQLRLDF